MTDAELLDVALEAARAGAGELLERFGRQDGVRTKSTPTDPVSDADLAAESAVRRVLSSRRPSDSILAEEGGASAGTESDGGAAGAEEGGAVRWIVDPLDGTVNYLFGIPSFAVSVACEDDSGTRAGVVLDPVRDECFTATRSGDATLNGASFGDFERASSLSLALVATGFGYDAAQRARQADVVSRVLPRARDIRRVGSAALDLAWSACGRFDAYYERGLKTWDAAAGALICERVGLVVRELPATDEDPFGLLVAPVGLVDELFELVVA